MLAEIYEYAKWLKEDSPDLFDGGVKEGLHIKIDFDDKGNIDESSYKSEIYNKKEIESNFLKELKEREIISTALGNNKGVLDKKLFSNNPYTIFFKFYFTNDKKVKPLVEEFYNENKEKDIQTIKEEFYKLFIDNRLDLLFIEDPKGKKEKKAWLSQYYSNIGKNYFDEKEIDTEEKNYKETIESFIFSKLRSLIIKDPNLEKMFIGINNKNKPKVDSTYLDKEIRINFNVPFAILKKASHRYFKKKVYTKDTYNRPKKNPTHGLSGYFNKLAIENKVFNIHRSAFFDVNVLVTIENALLLSEYSKIQKNLPNPLPIFIEKKELNKDVIEIFKSEEKKIGYKQIIENLFKKHNDLGNYYLFNGNSTQVNDFDFVSSFKLIPESLQTKENKDLIKVFVKDEDEKWQDYLGCFLKLKNIFDLEKLFNGKFFFRVDKKTKAQTGFLTSNYFTAPKDVKKEGIPSFILNNFYKYRKTLYDAIYKSKIHLISPSIFKDICLPVIRYDIAHNEDGKSGRIIEKLTAYLSLNAIFDKENKNFGGIDMASELPKFYNNLKELLNEDSINYEDEKSYYKSDEDFAFSTGQLIRFLLNQSESSNKNHSMFTPFLQKLGHKELFLGLIKKAVITYGHKLEMGSKRVNRLISNTMSYNLQNYDSLKELETVLISGYFAKSAIYEKKEQTNNNGQGE